MCDLDTTLFREASKTRPSRSLTRTNANSQQATGSYIQVPQRAPNVLHRHGFRKKIRPNQDPKTRPKSPVSPGQTTVKVLGLCWSTLVKPRAMHLTLPALSLVLPVRRSNHGAAPVKAGQQASCCCYSRCWCAGAAAARLALLDRHVQAVCGVDGGSGRHVDLLAGHLQRLHVV